MKSTRLTSAHMELICNKKVLFLNGIRSDVPSGGNTATRTLRDLWSPLCELHERMIAPDSTKCPSWLYALKSFPAGLFVFWYRCSRQVWLEFFSRFSPWLLASTFVAYLRLRPEVVVFNHHSTFPYAWAFPGAKRIFVWHDVPSFKRGAGVLPAKDRNARGCARLERLFLKFSDASMVLSFSERRILSRLHNIHAALVPVLASSVQQRTLHVKPNTWLLIGNWTRPENCNGALKFFSAYLDLLSRATHGASGSFRVAGNGAGAFVGSLGRFLPNIGLLTIEATSHYVDLGEFSEAALLAPILEGAGIKLKTLEAWSYGIPVIGSSQAFSGLPTSIWRQGGLMVRSIEEMAELTMGWQATCDTLNRLEPAAAYQAYQSRVAA